MRTPTRVGVGRGRTCGCMRAQVLVTARHSLTESIIYELIDECHEMYVRIGPLKNIKIFMGFFFFKEISPNLCGALRSQKQVRTETFILWDL